MKTADLIPFILLELAECDKYGFELTKNIETKSNGLLVIKQPTLYTVLKKLEKSKFISSYWEDSEIGGKRHYYKLTDNGKLQVSTLPSYETLLGNLANETSETDLEPKRESESVISVEQENPAYNHVSIMDALLETPTPVETVLPTEEVFAEESIDNATEAAINADNSEILQNSLAQKHEQFADNAEVSKFTEQNKVEVPKETKTKLAEHQEKIDILHVPTSFTARVSTEPIKYVDYVDIKSSPAYKKSKKITKNLFCRSLCTSLYLLLTLVLSTLATAVTGTSALYYAFLIMAVIGIIFYPAIIIFLMEKFRIKIQENPYKNNFKLNLFVAIGIFLSVLVLCIFVNIAIGNGSILKLFAPSNFANFYGPLFISTSVFADFLFNIIFMKKFNK